MRRDFTHACDHERVTPWFDTHAHLDRYDAAERGALLERARAANVGVIAVAVDLRSSRADCSIDGPAGRVVGVHPQNAASALESELRELAAQPGVVGIGECGFDDAGAEWEHQTRAFQAQCNLARELDLPIVLHVDGEEAWRRFEAVTSALDRLRVIRHYFTGNEVQARWHAGRGHYLSFGNPLRRDPGFREIAHGYPAERLLIETDSYPLPGRNTEPAHVTKVGETLALIRGWTFEEARERLAANTRTAFKLTALTAGR